MKQNWWKALGVVLLIYVFIMGMTVPLTPGILSVTPSSVRTGDEVKLEIIGYNTMYSESDPVQAWLKLDNERALKASRIEIKDARSLNAVFQIPEYLPVNRKVQDFVLVLDSEQAGTSVLPSAVFVTQDSIDPDMGQKTWVNSPISNLHERWSMTYPFRNILSETIRNTYFHVPLWFAMIFVFIASVFNSIQYLRRGELDYDNKAQSLTKVGILLGILGLVTGAIWARYTWGEFWSGDVKQNMTAIALLIYFAYFILRGVFEDPEKKGRISAVYNIFAFTALIPLIYVIPRLVDSLHPGAGGNPAFGTQDLDNTMRMVFYPAIIGWTLIGFWIASLLYRIDRINLHFLEMDE